MSAGADFRGPTASAVTVVPDCAERGRAVRDHHFYPYARFRTYTRNLVRRLFLPSLGVLVTLGLWQAVVTGFGVRRFFLPAPSDVLVALLRHGPHLLEATWVTLGHTLAGFGIAAVAGIVVALVLAAWVQLRAALLPIVVALQATPKVALAPLLIAWLGFGSGSKITLVGLLSFFPVLLATLSGVTATPVELIELARSHRVARWRVYLLIRLPWAAPQLVTGLQLGMSLALIGAVVAQITTPNAGLGAVIVRAGQSADTPLAFAAITLLAGLGIGLFYLLRGVELMETRSRSGTTGRQPSIGDMVRHHGPTFSFEFFPPKSPEQEAVLWRSIRELEALGPSFVSITYGAGGTTRDTTVEVTERVATETTLLPMAHLTAVNHSVAELRHVIGRLAAAGIRNLMLLRGDPPGDVAGEWVPHPEGLLYAEELVQLARQIGDFSLGVAAFPYKHPRSPDIKTDTEFFIQKCRAGADFAVTQMFFDEEEYLRLRDRVAAAGCDTPIVAGVMPVTSMRTIEKAELFSGAPFPPRLAAEFAKIADDPKAVRALGIEQATRMCQRLLDEGVPGIHFITLNRSTATREVWHNLGVGSVIQPVRAGELV